jgi:hypothetical protein
MRRKAKTYTLAVVSVLLFILMIPPPANAGQLCEILPMPCTFESPAFKFTVVDAETQRPLADVHALVEWQVHGPGGRLNGPLIVMDALSQSDGVLAFPAWGPIEGPADGIGIGRDPIITVFKPGYKALLIYNGDPSGTKETQRVRRFYRDGGTFALEPFRGTPEAWVKELDQVYAGIATPRSDEQSLQFRGPYLNRIRRVWAEREKMPQRLRGERGFFWFVEGWMRLLEGKQR